MYKINICEESKEWAKHRSSIIKKIKKILKEVLRVKKFSG